MKKFIRKLEIFVTVFLFLYLAFNVYAYLFVFPYYGFQFSSQGELIEIYSASNDSQKLILGDMLVSIEGVDMQELLNDRLTQYPKIQNSEITLEIQRGERKIQIQQGISDVSSREFVDRFFNSWWIGLTFWLFGTIAVLFVRPRDIQRNLLIGLCYISAIWLVAGTISRTNLFFAPFIMKTGLWLSMPIYIHFHWHFPKTLLQRRNDLIWIVLYSLGILGAIFQWLEMIPKSSYVAPFFLAVLGSGTLLIIRFFRRRDERGEIRILFLFFLISVLPTLIIAFANSFGTLSLAYYGSIVSLLALPISYFYLVYRRQLGNLQFRVNRLISFYLYILLIITVIFALFPITPIGSFSNRESVGLIAILAFGIALLTVLSFDPFQRFVERKILNIPAFEGSLIEEFSKEISTSLTVQNLERVLTNNILPSLLIRESAILLFEYGQKNPKIIAVQELEPNIEKQMGAMQFKAIPEDFGLGKIPNTEKIPSELAWLTFAIKINSEEQQNIFWLLGRKDPDDIYNQSEIELLLILAGQISIAIVNIEQASKLRALYQRDINIQEEERKKLARDLHDDVLNRLAVLYLEIEENKVSASFERNYKKLVENLRSKIFELRPPMLNFGLSASLAELVDDTEINSNVAIELDLMKNDFRYPPIVEEHIFRIIQQSLENALVHASASRISIAGKIDKNSISLSIEDNGTGMDLTEETDLVGLLSNRHFGLAGMMERAELISAKLSIESEIGNGSRISIVWKQ